MLMYRYINKEELNEYELEHGKLSYKNLFYDDDSMILCNEIAKDYDDLELVSGNDYDEDTDEYTDIYQYYIINDNLANRLKEIGEIVYYHNRLDIYILGITHFGTGWNYVLTNLELVKDDDDYYKAILYDNN